MLIVVSDTSPFRCFAHLQRLDVLAALFDELIVPPAVVHELMNPPSGQPAVDISTLTYARIVAPFDTQKVAELCRILHPGESEAIVIALELGNLRLLIDDADGRIEAQRLGLSVIGVLGLLRAAKERGLIPAIRPVLDELIRGLGFYIAENLRSRLLRDVGEQI